MTNALRLAAAPAFAAPPPLALYVHMPWCVRKCPYCDFNSHEARGGVPEQQYIDALMADLEQALPMIWGREVHTVFFGGGTPSLFSAEGMDQILSGLRARLKIRPFAEITLEANPGTFEAEKFRAFRAAGVNRLSIGIQSFNPVHLKALGRIHDDRQAMAAVEIAQASFDNFNLDLMYALPGQTIDEALADIRQAIAFAPKHLSAYQLTLEPNTYFHRFPPRLPDEDASAAIQEAIQAELATHGYRHYETSAYAREGFQCRHNLNYWTFGDYLGIGAGAHGKISLPDRVVRQARHRHPQAYMEKAMQGNAIQSEQDVAVKDLGFEFMMNALRLVDGFEVRLFQERSGLPMPLIERPLREAEEKGLIERDFRHIRPTDLGQRFLNDLLTLFLPDARAGDGVSDGKAGS